MASINRLAYYSIDDMCEIVTAVHELRESLFELEKRAVRAE